MSEVQIANKWQDTHADTLSEQELLLYRSNLLGSDLRITNYGGGNTSVKIEQQDPLTKKNELVLWVKGSGGDLGSITLDGFSTLYQTKLERLKSLYRGPEHEDEMVNYLPHCTFNLNKRAASIDTPLHAFVPHKHIDHMHPDAVIAIACTTTSKTLTEIVFNGEIGWYPWLRPGFELGLQIGKLAMEQPHLRGVVLEGHGLLTWGKTSKACYKNTLQTIQQATDWLKKNNRKPAFGGLRYDNLLSKEQRQNIASHLMPLIRGKITGSQPKAGHFNDSDDVMAFVNSNNLNDMSALGTSCPDHFLRTKIRPLVIQFNPDTNDIEKELKSCAKELDTQLNTYRQDYEGYYHRCKQHNSPAIRDSNAVVYLVPGVGMITFARDKATARIAGEFYVNAINVMREADGSGVYQGLSEQEAFNIEYWLLEEAKLQRMPKPKEFSGKVVFITGGAGGIGKATAKRFLQEKACVMLADIDETALLETAKIFSRQFSPDVVRTVVCDVTKEQEVINAFAYTAREFGGIDTLVCNAGIASSASIEDTTLEIWNKNMDILNTGYFLTMREGFKLLKTQGTQGSIVFVSSKNGLVASPNASAYCTAKAAEIQLARVVALEGAPYGIRCNVVNPDAVLRGSKIWTGKWREERASAHKLNNDELEEHYKQRSLLKLNVFPEDIAEAVFFLASNLSAKSTGNIINVDAGHPPSFSR